MRAVSSGTLSGTLRAAAAVALLGLAAVPRAGAQDSARVEPGAGRSAPAFGPRPQGPRHALWVQGGAMLSGRGAIGPAGDFELERRVSPHFSVLAHVQRWERSGFSFSVPTRGPSQYVSREHLSVELRARYYFGDRPMRGWWVAAGAGYARSQGNFREPESFEWQRLRGYTLASEAGYSWLLGDGARNRLGITLSAGAQRYYFPGGFNPYTTRTILGPRLRVGWTF